MSDLDRYQYGYDFNSNRQFKANMVGTPLVSGGLDEYYTYDHLNRLTVMQRGTLNTGRTGITGTPSRQMNYTLDPTGNWPAYVTQTNGSTDLNQTRTSNTVNEITAIGGTPGWTTPVYDPAGNMTTMPQPASTADGFTATYDAWDRLVSLNNSSGSVATYQYDGRGRRIVKTTPSETRHFYYTNKWQDIEERVGTATTMDKQYVWGARYIDELVCRDDADNATTPRLYAMQDANFNLTAVCSNTSGGVLERYLFDPYGNRMIMNASWDIITLTAYDWVVGYQGLPHDEETELLLARTRYTHVTAGRWLQRDEAYFDSLNLYEYETTNPVTDLDPFGDQSGSKGLAPGYANYGKGPCPKCTSPVLAKPLSINADPNTFEGGDIRLTNGNINKFVWAISSKTIDRTTGNTMGAPPSCLSKLTVVAHGTAGYLDLNGASYWNTTNNSSSKAVDSRNVSLFTKDLVGTTCFCKSCDIYLLSCNAALKGPLAGSPAGQSNVWQTLADGTGCKVHVPGGYCQPNIEDAEQSTILATDPAYPKFNGSFGGFRTYIPQ